MCKPGRTKIDTTEEVRGGRLDTKYLGKVKISADGVFATTLEELQLHAAYHSTKLASTCREDQSCVSKHWLEVPGTNSC